ncbi:MAG: elongation factor 4 [bacterium]|nr:elongation factor 4 [bacterium]
MTDKQKNTRNFCIIAHIDHGKSTLADRLLEVTGTVESRQMREQFLDSMDLERERGITIKMHPVTMTVKRSGEEYTFNLIDTPGHVDFSYEVSRSLAACEGALLVVDATQGVEAQTLANAYLAVDNDLVIIPAINKIDLDSAQIEVAADEIEEMVGLPGENALLISAKEGTGVDELIDRVIEEVPPPKGDADKPLKALIFDAKYDLHRGVLMYVRIIDGRVKRGDDIELMAAGAEYEVGEVGVFDPKLDPQDELKAGDVGYIAAGIKEIAEAKVGDTVTNARNGADEPLSGYKDVKPMVFCGLYPVDSEDYEMLKAALEKFALNDSALSYVAETSEALGFGFRCGFLGLLHMEIVQERLERDFDLELITTTPNVAYEVETNDGEVIHIETPSELPDLSVVESIGEPYVRMTIFTPSAYVGNMIELLKARRGEHKRMDFIAGDRVVIEYDVPLVEIIVDFFDRMKAGSRGYGSMDYDHIGYRKSDMVKLDILLNGKPVDALSLMIHGDRAYHRGRALTQALRKVIPRQMFEVVIQAAIGSRIIARETLKPMRKNVTAKCYGGDVTRKRKLLERQKEGKKKMKQIGTVSVPQEAFLTVLKVGD